MGEWKVTVDEKIKFVKLQTFGKVDAKEMGEACDAAIKAVKKFNKGEAVFVSDTSKLEMRFMDTEVSKIVNQFGEDMLPLTKRSAAVIPSFVLRKALELLNKVYRDGVKLCATEEEAMKYLLKD